MKFSVLALLISLNCLYLSSFAFQSNENDSIVAADIVVYGGTPAGVAAAIQSARLGKSVILIEPTGHVGGIMVNGLGGSDIDNHPEFQNSPAVGGIALEFYRRVATYYHRHQEFEEMLKKRKKDATLWRFEPHVAQKILDEWLAEYPIQIFLNTALAESINAVDKKQNVLDHIKSMNGKVFKGRVFIDCSLEGDLIAAAGISYTVGRESNRLYSETKNGIRSKTTHAQFKVRVDAYRTPGDPASGVIPTIQDEPFGTPGDGDRSIQAYCFRMCLTSNDSNRIPFSKPHGYDRHEYEIYLRYLRAGGKLYTPAPSIPNGKTDLGAWHDLSHNLYGMNKQYPDGSYEDRKEIFNEHKVFTQGLFYFLSNDSEVGQLDPALQQIWKRWGLCKDEFIDNGGWPRQFYVRDGRRMISDYVMTEHHTRDVNPAVIEDPVAVAFWPPDLHSARRIVRNGFAYNEGFVFGGNSWRPFGISYRSLIPKEKECSNLLTPTCLSSSHVAYGAIRIEFTYMALGQACALAAGLAVEGKMAVQKIDYKVLRKALLENSIVVDADLVGMPNHQENQIR